jgi:hypothetical protein
MKTDVQLAMSFRRRLDGTRGGKPGLGSNMWPRWTARFKWRPSSLHVFRRCTAKSAAFRFATNPSDSSTFDPCRS